MTNIFQRRSARRTALAALLVPAFLLTACGDDDDDPSGPGVENVNGTWAFVDDGQTSFALVTDDDIQVFENTGTCYFSFSFDIVAREGSTFTVNDGSGEVEWELDRVGANLVFEDEDGVSTTLTPSTVNPSTLAMCEDILDADFPHAACATLTQLGLPGSVSGDIEPGDARWTDDTWYDIYRLSITETTDVNITMSADDQDALNTYLILFEATGVDRLEEEDDGAEGTDARIQTTLDPGCYIVVAASWQGDQAGETGGGYTLTASTELVSDFPHETCTAIPEVPVGGSVSGELEDGDPRWSAEDQSWYDLWSLQLDTEQTVTITMEEDGSGIDTFMRLYNSLGTLQIESNDDIDFDAGNFNSQIADITLDAGCYIIVANSYEGDDEGEVGGAYTLSVD